ncbi:Iron-sulfur cluster repair protein ScdA [Phycisphaerales bacterium]|nr:Iron-sulfur cluster repair protein ScdA [Phycisphaerales bacterium]
MDRIDATTEVGQIAADWPGAARVFERLDIDYCCAGRRSLDEACSAKGVSVQQVLTEIAHSSADPVDAAPDGSSMAALIDHITRTHHAAMKTELPRLAQLVERVANAHAQHHPELPRLKQVFHRFAGDLLDHMRKEEVLLFPILRAIDAGSPAPAVSGPILKMMQEHESAGDGLAQMSALTSRYAVPADACGAYRALMEGLKALEQDMHRHVHLENNVLFPEAGRRVAPSGGCGGARCSCRHESHPTSN